MCGICGILSIKKEYSIAPDLLPNMMNAIKHRGPDSSGCYIDETVALGHLRLSIIDIGGGSQPIYSDNKTKCIIFNGEIYNYQEVKEGLLSKGYRFSTNSDTEVILKAYEDCGESCVSLLRGMFAFAIWDEEQKKLFIARDRVGIKPLYYYMSDDYFCFSSEIKSLTVARLVNPELNYNMLDVYLSLNYTLGPETMFKGVRKLMPGNCMTIQHGKIRIWQYWDFDKLEENNEPLDRISNRLEELIFEATKMHLISDVPLGVFLSGGLDSSYITGLVSKITGKQIKTFSVGYDTNDGSSELNYARIVAKHFNTEHHEFILNPKEFLDVVNDVVWGMDEPVAEYATIPLLHLSKMAKRYVTVVLSGEGADEVFGGYPIYRIMKYIEMYNSLPSGIRDKFLFPILKKVLGSKKEGKYIDWISAPIEKRYLGNGSRLTDSIKQRLYSKDLLGSLNNNYMQKIIDSYYDKVNENDTVRQMLYLDTKTWLPEDLLIKADKMTMAASLELRVPFLDHKVVEFATSIPSKHKVSMRGNKVIFRELAKKILPPDIINRKKQGFTVPMKVWLRNEMREFARNILLDKKSRERGFFDYGYVESILTRHDELYDDLSATIWNLVVLELWHRRFIDNQ